MIKDNQLFSKNYLLRLNDKLVQFVLTALGYSLSKFKDLKKLSK